jgi:hypothetical protein
VTEAQQNAILANDAANIDAKTAALEILIREAAQAEAERHRVLRKVVEHFDLPPERQTMTELVAVAPEPWRSRLAESQTRIRNTVSRTRAYVRTNRRVLRQSMRVVDQCLSAIQHCEETGAARYGADGMEPARNQRAPSLLDQKG